MRFGCSATRWPKERDHTSVSVKQINDQSVCVVNNDVINKLCVLSVSLGGIRWPNPISMHDAQPSAIYL